MGYKICYWIYLRLIRVWSSPLIYWVIRSFIDKRPLPKIWNTINTYDSEKFENYIIQYSYKWDWEGGKLDFTLQNPNYFFVEKEYFRDCDDFARMWYLWAKENNYQVWEICLWDKLNKAHMITVYKDGNYKLCDYKLKGEFESLEQAAESVAGYNNWLIYKE